MKLLFWGILLFVLAHAGLPVQNEMDCTEASLYSLDCTFKQNPSNNEKNLPKKKEEKEDKEENEEKEDDRSEEENKFKETVLHASFCEFYCVNTIQLMDAQSAKIELLAKWTAALVAPLYILYSDLKVNC